MQKPKDWEELDRIIAEAAEFDREKEYPYVLIVGPKKGQRCRIVDLGWRSRLGYGSRHIETEDGSHITINRLFLRRKDHGNLTTNTTAGDHPQT